MDVAAGAILLLRLILIEVGSEGLKLCGLLLGARLVRLQPLAQLCRRQPAAFAWHPCLDRLLNLLFALLLFQLSLQLI